jgi:sulfatase maturation enzyme AslB (radical SAM superfamily)
MQRTDYVNVNTKQVLISNIANSVQAKDLSIPPNCNGFGRIHTFKRNIENWGDDPLPICPAIKALGLQDNLSTIKTQVFQVGYCNMKCWYCFVPDELKNGTQGEFKRVDELMELFLVEPDRPKVIDLSGGNPELVPEWILWFMEELIKRNLEKNYYLWSDDTLSTKNMFNFLTKKEIEFMASYKNYGKVCCFKGFDEYSYEFNSKFNKTNYFAQFDLIKLKNPPPMAVVMS